MLGDSILVFDACIIALAASSHVALFYCIAKMYKRLSALELTVFSIPSTSALIDTIIEHKVGESVVETKVNG